MKVNNLLLIFFFFLSPCVCLQADVIHTQVKGVHQLKGYNCVPGGGCGEFPIYLLDDDTIWYGNISSSPLSPNSPVHYFESYNEYFRVTCRDFMSYLATYHGKLDKECPARVVAVSAPTLPLAPPTSEIEESLEKIGTEPMQAPLTEEEAKEIKQAILSLPELAGQIIDLNQKGTTRSCVLKTDSVDLYDELLSLGHNCYYHPQQNKIIKLHSYHNEEGFGRVRHADEKSFGLEGSIQWHYLTQKEPFLKGEYAFFSYNFSSPRPIILSSGKQLQLFYYSTANHPERLEIAWTITER